MPRLSILIATVGEREKRFRELLDVLAPQVSAYGDQIEVLIHWNNFEHKIADIRQALIDEAKGDYVCFIDDDDMVPPYYCERIMTALEQDPDYVGWKMQLYWDGKKMKPTYHSIHYEGWSDDKDGYYRDISHLNPIRRSIAQQVPFRPPVGGPEDYNWALRVSPLVMTEVYIPATMYFYHYNSLDSVWRGKSAPDRDYHRPRLFKYGSAFRYHPDCAEWYYAPRSEAVIVVDVWDRHWHEPTQEALDNGLAARINEFVAAMRDRGAAIIHAPTSVALRHKGAKMPVIEEFADGVKAPKNLFHEDVSFAEAKNPPWTRQHPDVQVRPSDYVSDRSAEIFSLLRLTGVRKVYLVGVHTDLCVVHNSFAAFNLRKLGFNPVIVDDLCMPMKFSRDEMNEKLAQAGFVVQSSQGVLSGQG